MVMCSVAPSIGKNAFKVFINDGSSVSDDSEERVRGQVGKVSYTEV